MILFSKDKELIFKITNAILLLWLVGAIALTLVSVVNLLVKEPELTYAEFEVTNCRWYKDVEDVTDDEAKTRCREEYEAQKVWQKNNDFHYKKAIYTAGVNIIVVGGVLFLMNFMKKKDNKKKL